jgi:hypothetical protein
MRIRDIIFIFVCFSQSPVVGYSQGFIPEYNLKRDSLISNKVNLLVEYEFIEHGIKYIPENDDCFNYQTLYLFWIADGIYYKQKFTECKTYPVMELRNYDFLNMVSENFDEIKNTKLLPARSNKIVEIVTSHDNEWVFKFQTIDENFEKVISDFKLNTSMIEENEPNINFETNQNSILKQLIDLVAKETD